MKILIIDEDFPYPLDTGKKIRSFYLARYLAVRNEVSYLAYGRRSDDLLNFMKGHNITPYFVDPPNRKKQGLLFYFKLFMNLFSSYPYAVTSHYTRGFLDFLNRIIGSNSYDIVICEGMAYAVFLTNIDGVRKVIAAHNIEAEIWRGYEDNEENYLKKLYITLQRIKIEKFENNALGSVNGATAVTEHDADRINNLGVNYPVKVIYNGVDLDYFQPQDIEIDRNLLVFTGSMDYMANQDAAVYFVRKIFPLVKNSRPEIKAMFVGRKPPSFIKELEKVDGITITGTVEDVRPYIARAGLYFVPLRIGGGSRLKILEAMAMKKAIVSTSLGGAGLNVTDNENIIIKDGEEQFAEAVINCLNNDDLVKRLGENGRKLVEAQYGWEQLSWELDNYLSSLLDKR